MTTDTKAVVRYRTTLSHGLIEMQEHPVGPLIFFADHERVVGELEMAVAYWKGQSDAHVSDLQDMRATLAASRAEVEGLKKDAERWNWIMEGHYGNEPARANRVIGACWSRKAMEDAIDNDIATQAAMEKGNV